jgi:hypothetical protein
MNLQVFEFDKIDEVKISENLDSWIENGVK